MHETGKAGAGMAEPPWHHVMPKDFREWFAKRGFTGETDIKVYKVSMIFTRWGEDEQGAFLGGEREGAPV